MLLMMKAGDGIGSTMPPTLSATPIPSSIALNHAKMYVYTASISEIFGENVKPGRELLEAIIETYKARMFSQGDQGVTRGFFILISSVSIPKYYNIFVSANC